MRYCCGILIVFLCISCSFMAPIYLVNNRSSDVIMQLTIKQMSDTSKLSLVYAKDMDSEGYKPHNLGEKINFTQLNDNLVQVIIPSNSTILLANGRNQYPDYFSSYKLIYHNGKQEVVSEKQFLKTLKRKVFYNVLERKSYFIL